jgi:prolyl-tRNA synthetase
LRLPPKVAPVQVIVVVVKADPEVAAAAENLERELTAAGLRVRVDDRVELGLGRRLTDWELKGVPVRVEIGPRDLAHGTVSIARRDGTGREPVKLGDAVAAASAGVLSVHDELFAQATEALRSGTVDVDDLDGATEAGSPGFARLPWAACGPDGERRLNSAGLSVRCLTTPDGSIPSTADADDLYAIIARAY